MATTRKIGFDARLDVIYNYYNHYQNYFKATCNIVCVDLKMYPENYWELYQGDIWRYLHDIAVTANHWADNLIKIAKHNRPSPNFSEEERYLYWFLHHTYRIDGYTDYKGLKRIFRAEYKKFKG